MLARFDAHGSQTLLANACDLVESIDDTWKRAITLQRLIPLIPDTFVARAFAIARGLQRGSECGVTLVALAPRLPKDLLDEAESVANEIDDGDSQLLARVSIAARRIELLNGKKGGRKSALAALLREIRQHPWVIDTNLEKAIILLCTYIPNRDVIPILRQLASPVSLARVTAEFLRYRKRVPDAYLNFEEWDDKWDMVDHDWRQIAAAFKRDVPLLPHLRQQVLKKAIPSKDPKMMWPTRYPSAVAERALLASCVPEQQRDEFVARILEETTKPNELFDDGTVLSKTIVALARHLPDHLLEGALRVSSWIPHGEHRAAALSALAQNFGESRRETLRTAVESALRDSERIGDADQRAKALAALVPYLTPNPPDDDVKRILEAAEGASLLPRCKLLGALALRLREEQRQPLLALKEALGEVRKETHNFSQNEALAALIPGLPDALVPEAHDLSNTLASDVDARALAKLLSRLDGDDRRAAIERVLLAAPIADGGLEYISGEMLVAVGPYFLEPEQEGRWNELVGHLPETWRHEARRARQPTQAKGSEGEPVRQPVALPARPATPRRSSELERAIDDWPKRTRPQVLNDIDKYARDLFEMGGSDLMHDAVSAICDAARWWP